jgi:hypothetical protein
LIELKLVSCGETDCAMRGDDNESGACKVLAHQIDKALLC